MRRDVKSSWGAVLPMVDTILDVWVVDGEGWRVAGGCGVKIDGAAWLWKTRAGTRRVNGSWGRWMAKHVTWRLPLQPQPLLQLLTSQTLNPPQTRSSLLALYQYDFGVSSRVRFCLCSPSYIPLILPFVASRAFTLINHRHQPPRRDFPRL